MMNKIQASRTELTNVNWSKTEKEERESEGSAENVNIGVIHQWSSRMKHRDI